MNREQFLELARVFPEPLFLLSENGMVLAVNSAATDLWGAEDESLRGRYLAQLTADPPQKIASYLSGCSKTGMKILGNLSLLVGRKETLVCRSEGVVIQSGSERAPALILLRFTPEGPAGGGFPTSNLLTNEQAAREEAEQANRLRDEFLATVSHELKTPLNAMLGWLHILQTGKLDQSGIDHAIETIHRNAKLQAQLIEEILDVSNIITGKFKLDIRRVDLASVIELAIQAVHSAAEAKDIQIKTVFNPTVGFIAGDADRLQQIVWNLLSNAVKFTPNHGVVEVRLDRIDSQVQLTVSDNGEGIVPDFLPFVFDRFRQADSTSERRYQGLGLGLAIVRHLVELHGGTVKAESPGRDQGATFTIKLPIKAILNEHKDKETEQNQLLASNDMIALPKPILDGLRVLVVDDEIDAREMLIAALTLYGAQVTATQSAAEALAELEQHRPDVLISDLAMPDEDGFSLIRKVRALEPEYGGDIPAVALTAFVRAEDRINALAAGYQMHVPKPVEPDELAFSVARLVGRTENRLKP